MLINLNQIKLLFLYIIALSTAQKTDVDVIIIGAGWSGMGAADHLVRAKHNNFLVLEATNFTGGRTHAFKFGDPSVGQFIMALGSNWIDGAPFHGGPSHKLQPIYEEALRLKKTFRITQEQQLTNDSVMYVYDSNGTQADVDGSIRRKAYKAIDCLNKTASRGGKDVNLRAALVTCGWEPKTEVEWAIDWPLTVDGPGIPAKEQSLLNTYPDPTVQWWGDQAWMVVDQNPRGFAHLLDTMTADTIPPSDSRLLFNTIVTQIDYTSTPIKVTSRDGRVFTAKHVISTLPLGVIQRNHTTLFVPAMPKKQVKALTNDGFIMNHLTKIFIQFKTAFWDPNAAYWINANSEVGAFTEYWNMNHPLHMPGSNTLFIWLGDPQSTKWEASTDAEVIAAIMKNLRQRYPGKDLEDPVAFHMTRHSLDPTRYGAYSTAKEGFTEHDYNQAIKPLRVDDEKRVYFAGEHACQDLSGYTHGALIMGREVAATVYGEKYTTMCDW